MKFRVVKFNNRYYPQCRFPFSLWWHGLTRDAAKFCDHRMHEDDPWKAVNFETEEGAVGFAESVRLAASRKDEEWYQRVVRAKAMRYQIEKVREL